MVIIGQKWREYIKHLPPAKTKNKMPKTGIKRSLRAREHHLGRIICKYDVQ